MLSIYFIYDEYFIYDDENAAEANEGCSQKAEVR